MFRSVTPRTLRAAYFADAGCPGSPSPAKSSALERVERLLCLALRLRPMLLCLRTRRFQVSRVFEAMTGVFSKPSATGSIHLALLIVKPGSPI